MDLEINGRLFIVTGATSGLGNGVAINLLNDGAKLIIIGRDQSKLDNLASAYPGRMEGICGDIYRETTIDALIKKLGDRFLSGILINAGGPPAGAFLETEIAGWDEAYKTVLRWKVILTQRVIPIFKKQKYGRMVYIESHSVKQPVANLVLSNSLRMAVVGFVKTLSQEVAGDGITLNILAPGFHETAAAERLFVKRSKNENISVKAAKQKYIEEMKVGKMGDPLEFGMLGAWLLSPHAGYVTGHVHYVDGASLKATL